MTVPLEGKDSNIVISKMVIARNIITRRGISQIPDSLTWGDSDPTINMFSVKLKPVN